MRLKMDRLAGAGERLAGAGEEERMGERWGPMGTALAPERMGDLTTSAKDLWSTLDEAGTQDLASSLEKSLNSSL